MTPARIVKPTASTRLLLQALCLAASVVLIDTGFAEAHMKVTPREWAFSSYTRDNDDRRAAIDPITVAWVGQPTQYTPDRIETAIDNQWYGADWTSNSDCLFDIASNQGLWYNNQAGEHAEYDSEQDLNLLYEEERCGFRQYHSRLWNDFEHTALFPGVHTSSDNYTWMVGGIHREQRRASGPGFLGHRLIESFERSAQSLYTIMSLKFCKSASKWRYLPGSEGRDRVNYGYSNGYLTKIDLSKVGFCD